MTTVQEASVPLGPIAQVEQAVVAAEVMKSVDEHVDRVYPHLTTDSVKAIDEYFEGTLTTLPNTEGILKIPKTLSAVEIIKWLSQQ